jgi:hypothetical protein
MSFTVPVCWRKLDEYKPSTNPKDPYVDFIKGPSSAYTNDEISIGSTTQITFETTSNCQFPAVSDFKIHVQPDPTGLVRVVADNGTSITVEATYKQGVKTSLRMGFTNNQGGPGYNSGKPVIRNDPQHVIPAYQIYALVALVALGVAFFLYRRSKRSQWKTD